MWTSVTGTGSSNGPPSAPTADAAWRRLIEVRTPADAARMGLRQTAEGRWAWGGDHVPAEADELANLYTPLCLAGPSQVFAQLGQSVDGFIAARTGDACFVTGEEDRRHLHRLRALADAVVVGASTAVADDPQLTVRAVAGRSPTRVVLDPHGRVPAGQRVLTDASAPTLLITTAAAPRPGLGGHVELVRLPGDASDRLSSRTLLDALADRGLTRVLVEGGGATVSRFLVEGALDRLYLTVAPVLIGDGVPGLRFAGPTLMSEALRPPARRFAMGADVLFELDLSTASQVPGSASTSA